MNFIDELKKSIEEQRPKTAGEQLARLEHEVTNCAWNYGGFSPEHNKAVENLERFKRQQKVAYETNIHDMISEVFKNG